MIKGQFIKSLVSKTGPVVGEYNGDFQLVRLNLVKAGLPKELLACRENEALGLPIIIEKNNKHYGHVEASQYEPKAVVVCGGQRRKALLSKGVVHHWVWMEAGALVINADDAMGANELLTKLNAVLANKFNHGNNMLPNQSYPYVLEAYPFENYCIYCLKSVNYKQYYSLDPVTRSLQLLGPPSQVTTKYVDAAVADTGLIANIMYGWTNMEQAAATFVARTKAGNYVPLNPDFAPVRITGAGHIVTALAAQGISPLDFALWSLKAQKELEGGGPGSGRKGSGKKDSFGKAANRTNDKADIMDRASKFQKKLTKMDSFPDMKSMTYLPSGKFNDNLKAAANASLSDLAAGEIAGKQLTTKTRNKLPKSKFAYGDKLPINDPAHARNAASRVNQTKGIPESAKPGVLSKIRKAEKKFGVSPSDKPTSGQKSWSKEGKK